MHRPVKFVHIERFSSRKLARERELEVQSWRHDEKVGLVENTSKIGILEAI